MSDWSYDVCVVGGCGRVGLPLALAFADRGLRTSVQDLNEEAVREVSSGRFPYREEGASELLTRVLGNTLGVTTDTAVIGRSENVVIVIGTPVDEHLNPRFSTLVRLTRDLAEHLVDGQLVVLRSTVYPGTTLRLAESLAELGRRVDVSFCPERIAEGKALEELRQLPQIVSGVTPAALERSRQLFGRLTSEVVELSPFEAELAKLFTNSWRYIQFAIANQFYMISQAFGVDFYRIHEAMRYKYPRAQGFPRAGFAAGPCLFKDTMQLASFNNNTFFLGHSAMLVNEGLPSFLVSQLKQVMDLSRQVVGILGMAFKPDIDDPRDSLSYKLRKVLQFEARAVLCSDPYIQEPGFVSPQELLERCQLVVLGAPHAVYRDLSLPPEVKLVDVWNFFGRGGLIA